MLFEMIKVNYSLEIQEQENLLCFFFLQIKPILSTYVNSPWHILWALQIFSLCIIEIIYSKTIFFFLVFPKHITKEYRSSWHLGEMCFSKGNGYQKDLFVIWKFKFAWRPMVQISVLLFLGGRMTHKSDWDSRYHLREVIPR